MNKSLLFAMTVLAALTAAMLFPTRTANADVVKGYHEITHIFTHAVIADPQLAFDENNEMRDAYNTDCITSKEFRAILTSLHEKNFMLVDPCDVYSGGEKIPFYFPEGKKPLILSFDDINYYIKKMHLGMNDRLVLSNGRIGSLLNGKVDYDNEVVSILENFVAAHPDFSYKGAKGLICLTGFDGIFGYRTQSGSGDRAAQMQAVKPLVAKLKSSGWRFACHSYGHYHMRAISDKKFFSDTDKWLTEVEPLIGKTDIYVYPYGEYEVLDGGGKLSPKHRYLRQKGFNLFCGVGTQPYFSYLPKSDNKALFMDRIPFDGFSLRNRKKTYKPYFDFDKIYDFAARPN